MQFDRFAVYYTPPDGALARFGARWLGWDIAAGHAVAQPEPNGLPAPLAELTATPARYGFHATIKPPFRLAEGGSVTALGDALERLCDQVSPIQLDGLRPTTLGRFLALVPVGDQARLNGLAALAVETLDAFRAPLTEDELARRRHGARLGPRQETLLARWGYPYVMDGFRFHMTLTGALPPDRRAAVRAVLDGALSDALPHPFLLDGLSLVGQAADGRFHLVHRRTLSS